eukprot:4445299-Lingulodinium_polyedra.AAC.1
MTHNAAAPATTGRRKSAATPTPPPSELAPLLGAASPQRSSRRWRRPKTPGAVPAAPACSRHPASS